MKSELTYIKQAKDLASKLANNELSDGEIIALVIEARKQRDEYKIQRNNFKKGNQAIAERLLKVGGYLDKADKLLKLY